MTELVQIISTVGFPIVAFFVAVYGLKYAFDKSSEVNKEAFERLASLTDAVNRNTEVLTGIVDYLKGDEDNDK